MSLDTRGYFEHLQEYIMSDYVVDSGQFGTITLKEKYFTERSSRARLRQVELSFDGQAFAVKLDGVAKPLYSFLDDNGKPWSKRCDFVVFHLSSRQINLSLIEFKSELIDQESIVSQLSAGLCWCQTLKSILRTYSRADRRLYARKYVFTSNSDPVRYLDRSGKYLEGFKPA
jgi:hypothetical protein